MKKIVMLVAALAMFSSANANAAITASPILSLGTGSFAVLDVVTAGVAVGAIWGFPYLLTHSDAKPFEQMGKVEYSYPGQRQVYQPLHQ